VVGGRGWHLVPELMCLALLACSLSSLSIHIFFSYAAGSRNEGYEREYEVNCLSECLVGRTGCTVLPLELRRIVSPCS
jgi:hypothetical protein